MAVVNLTEHDFNGSVGVPFVFHALFVVDVVFGCDLSVRLKEIIDYGSSGDAGINNVLILVDLDILVVDGR